MYSVIQLNNKGMYEYATRDYFNLNGANAFAKDLDTWRLPIVINEEDVFPSLEILSLSYDPEAKRDKFLDLIKSILVISGISLIWFTLWVITP